MQLWPPLESSPGLRAYWSLLEDKTEEHGLRAYTQCGFRKNHGTLDAIFTLQHLICKARRKKQRLYTAFIGFEKAFDLTSRHEMLQGCK